MSPSVRFEGFGQQWTVIQSKFIEQFKSVKESIISGFGWMEQLMRNKAGAGRKTIERLQLWCNTRPIALKGEGGVGGDQLL